MKNNEIGFCEMCNKNTFATSLITFIMQDIHHQEFIMIVECGICQTKHLTYQHPMHLMNLVAGHEIVSTITDMNYEEVPELIAKDGVTLDHVLQLHQLLQDEKIPWTVKS
jgi:D-arabinose 1-dehydrogenase-like Zn-dependent alcohol dehydrogenase